MRTKQIKPKRIRKYRNYSHHNLTAAYLAVMNEGLPVTQASKIHSVPEQTLRDRVTGKIHITCSTTGTSPTFTLDEEAKIVAHLQDVARYGYRYNRLEVLEIVTDFAVQLGKRTRSKPLSLKWFRSFIVRWPQLQAIRPMAVEKHWSASTMSTYFDELEEVLKKYTLENKPHLIFNLYEKRITHHHSLSHIVTGMADNPKVANDLKSETTTLIGCGNASGMALPPFFVFVGKKMDPDLLKDACPGSSGTVSDTGLPNSYIFRYYLQNHFLKFIPQKDPDEYLLVLLDGHESHVPLGIREWAKAQKILLSILPAHSSHLLQPLDVACYGPFQEMYSSESYKFLKQTSAIITSSNVSKIASKVYFQALSVKNLRSAFCKTGIHPFNRDVIGKEDVNPLDAFQPDDRDSDVESVEMQKKMDLDQVSGKTKKKDSVVKSQSALKEVCGRQLSELKSSVDAVRKAARSVISYMIKPKRMRKYRTYSHDDLTAAYMAVMNDSISVTQAAKIHSVPEQTLRDRVTGKIHITCSTSGTNPIFTQEEESKIVAHFEDVAKYGYRYNRREVLEVVTDFAVELGKRTEKKPLSLNWYRSFIVRWPQLQAIRPMAVDKQSFISISISLSTHFDELEEALKKYTFHDKPHLIFSVSEKRILHNHSLSHIVTGMADPKVANDLKSETTTLIGCGNASGMALPPFFVFVGKKMDPDLLKDACPGSSGTVSDTGLSNSDVFRYYLQNHFLKFIPQKDPNEYLLLLLDGHAPHVPLGIREWAKAQKILLSILPAHSSHLLQPLDVACYGPFQEMYNSESYKFLKQTSVIITRSNVSKLVSKVYFQALSVENLRSAFCKTGIHPFNRDVVSKEDVDQLDAFQPEDRDSDDESDKMQKDMFVDGNKQDNVVAYSQIISEKRESSIEQQLIEQQSRQKNNVTKKCKLDSETSVKKKQKKNKHVQLSDVSANYTKSDVSSMADSDSGSEKAEKENCCVCGLFTPTQVTNSAYIIFTKWVKCDNKECFHWVHLKYCTSVSVVRRGQTFFCPHCPTSD